MNDNTRNQMAFYGLEILKTAVLSVLYDATARTEGLIQSHEIRQRLGLPRPGYIAGNTNALIRGILCYLKDEGAAEHDVGRGWHITDEGVSLIEAADASDSDI